MDEGVWDDTAPRASEVRPAGLKRLLMEEIVSSLRVLNAASSEMLTAESHEDQEQLVQAMTHILGWLHRHIATLLHTEAPYKIIKDEKTPALNELLQVFLHWHKLQTKSSMQWKLWLLWTQLGCTLEVLRCCEAVTESWTQLVMTSPPPQDFPTSRTHCNKEKQVAFSCQLWDAVVTKPLYEVPVNVAEDVAFKLIEVYLHWMTAAMRGYEVAFIANVATPLREHLQVTTKTNLLLADVWGTFANLKMETGGIVKSAASVAVTVLVLSALTSTRRTQEVVGYLESLSAATVDELTRGSFPQPHNPVAIVSMALGLSSLDDARPPRNSAIPLPSTNVTLLCQFALLRLISLQQLLPRLKPYDDTSIAQYQMDVHQRLKALVAEQAPAVLQECSLRMTEVCIEEMIGGFQTSLGSYLPMMEAMQLVLPKELFQTKMLTHLQSPAGSIPHDETFLTSPPEIVAFLKQFYGGAAPILEVLSTGHLVRAFLALSRIEFAREVCKSPTVNAFMQSVTQQLEQSLEQTATPPETIFAPVLRSLAKHSMIPNSDISPEVDIVAGCQTLAVGLVVQRKLRILLFQCVPLIDDALAVVFSGLYSIFEPVDAFAHRFLGVCLTHLGQFTPLFTIFPHYLQVTLAAYPTNASPQVLTKTCGAIFGSLFYSEAQSANDSEITETANRMVLWAIRKCCERTTELLAEEDKAAVSTKSVEDVAGEKVSVSETDGLYLAGLVFELMKMSPMKILKASAMEAERLLARWKSSPSVLRELKAALFASISQNCEAEKRAWLAAWYIEIDKQYPVNPPTSTPLAASRL